ncbi:MAG: invasion associated locus B family protein [Methyloligellaceae bacterium]
MRLRKLIALPVLSAALCFSTLALAKEEKKEAPSRLPWIVNCASNGANVNCVATQQLFLQKTRQLLLGITVRVPPKSRTGVMMVQLPHGLHLPAGITLEVDEGGEVKQAIQTCNVQGCFVGMTIETGLLKKMQTGKAISITFKNQNKKDVKIGVPLKGFAEAYQKLKS